MSNIYTGSIASLIQIDAQSYNCIKYPGFELLLDSTPIHTYKSSSLDHQNHKSQTEDIYQMFRRHRFGAEATSSWQTYQLWESLIQVMSAKTGDND